MTLVGSPEPLVICTLSDNLIKIILNIKKHIKLNGTVLLLELHHRSFFDFFCSAADLRYFKREDCQKRLLKALTLVPPHASCRDKHGLHYFGLRACSFMAVNMNNPNNMFSL